MKRMILVGVGHSHIEVLRRFAADRPANVELIAISSFPKLIYTGMLPGLIAGIYHLDECQIDIRQLAERAGAAWVASTVIGIDPISKALLLDDDSRLYYDFLSLNIGALPARDAIQGASSRTIPIKPLHEFFHWWDNFLMQPITARPLRIGIIGAGAGGVELALAMQHRLQSITTSPFSEIFLLTGGNRIMPGHNRLVRHWLENVLTARGIAVHTHADIVQAEEKCVHSADGRVFHFDHAIWTTGAAPEVWLRHSGLTTDAKGFIAVNSYLQSLSHPEIFAAGDVATLIHEPRPKSGVYAVRQGPILAENLHRALEGKPLRQYRPQRHALALIGTGKCHAVASRGQLALRGNWVWRYKEWIDRRFVRKYQIS